tara:strand:- start:1445 stop:3244 length:1800 start_codon:yes stop_codon:yes gene_type:complete
MKFIGQHIYDLVSRFRNKSFFTDVVDITTATDSGASALLIDNNDVDQVALDIDAANTTANAIRVKAQSLTTAAAVYINCDSLTSGKALRLDVDDALTATATKTLLDIDYDKAGVTASGQTSTTTGLSINMADAATNHASGAVTMIGSQIDIDSASNQGTITKKGLVLNVAADGVADSTNTSGIEINTIGNHLKLISSNRISDFCTIGVAESGATLVSTVDSVNSGDDKVANFEIAADGDITLDASGQIKLEPLAGNNILLDGTVTVDGGSVTGITTLGLDSVSLTAVQTSAESFVDNDTSLMTSAAIDDRINAAAGGGDITGVRLTADDTNTATVSSGSADFTIAGGAGVDTSVSGTTVTIAGETATDSNAGIVELATTGEADTGTDTARAVTPAGLKSHVDLRHSYAYMVWSASAVPTRDGSNNPEWMLPNTTKGIYEEDWNNDSGITATSTGTTTYTLSRLHAVNSLVIPHDGILVGFHAHGRNANSDNTFKAGLFHADGSTTSGTNTTGIDYGNTAAVNEFTLRCVATADEAESSGGADGTSNHSFKGPCKLVSNTANLAVTAGDALLPAIMGSSANSSDEIFVTMTIILKIPLTT